MTDFFAYCETATTNCDSDVYNANYFDGWSIGATVDIDTYSHLLQSGAYVGICFEDIYACFGFGLNDSAGFYGDLEVA